MLNIYTNDGPVDTYDPINKNDVHGGYIETPVGAFDFSHICWAEERTDKRLKSTREYSLKASGGYLVGTLDTFRLEETIENVSAETIDFLWGHHIGFHPESIISGDIRLQAPASSYFDAKEEPILRMRWPFLADGTDISKVSDEISDSETAYYLSDFTEGRCALQNSSKKIAVELRWDAMQFPYCWLRQRGPGGLQLSPFSGLPNAAEEGHGLASIPPGGKVSTWIEVAYVPLQEPRA